MKAPITFAIAGFGDRGSTYASMQKLFPDRMKVVAVADINPEKVQNAKELYGIKDELCFTSAEEMLAQDKLADVMVVSTMDRQHVNHAIPALEKGYNILMEKPISPDLQECKRIIEVAKHCPGKIIVCHVLRYTTFYNTLKSILDSKKIGDVVSVCANENVGYWHQAHSFVRGNCSAKSVRPFPPSAIRTSSKRSAHRRAQRRTASAAAKRRKTASSMPRRSTSRTPQRASATAIRGWRALPAA